MNRQEHRKLVATKVAELAEQDIRLLACDYAEHVLHLAPDDRLQRAIDEARGYATGGAFPWATTVARRMSNAAEAELVNVKLHPSAEWSEIGVRVAVARAAASTGKISAIEALRAVVDAALAAVSQATDGENAEREWQLAQIGL